MQYVSITEAARWLRERGIRPSSRAALYLAVAKGELAAFTPAPRVMLIRMADLKAYAGRKEQTAKSA